MKNLIFIGGPQGAGKTTAALKLTDKLENSVMLDGDWSAWQGINWNYSKNIIDIQLKNICFILKNFCGINEFKNIIFCWVLATSETQKIILQSLKNYKFNFYNISLICDEKTIYKRLLNREIETYPNLDYEKCKLQISELFDRSRKIINSYSYLDTIKIDVSNLSSDKTVQEILKIIK